MKIDVYVSNDVKLKRDAARDGRIYRHGSGMQPSIWGMKAHASGMRGTYTCSSLH
ncbi:hypothetical protein X777_11369 [Ooceraea biroi]|uniref:Uncharacterized protein n=1 Tax=Ooceraea biroi TaxID=2015173 RepID=A0A026W2R3_OOCBI|nr:hypothetical protein X777_11369 [Ooceraea biroi]